MAWPTLWAWAQQPQSVIGFASPGKFGKFGLTFVFFLFQRQHYCKTFAVGSIHSSLYWSNAQDSGFTIKDLRSAPNEKRSTADEQQLEAIMYIISQGGQGLFNTYFLSIHCSWVVQTFPWNSSERHQKRQFHDPTGGDFFQIGC